MDIRTSVRWAAALVVFAIAAGCLSGCRGDESPPTESTATVSQAVTGTPSLELQILTNSCGASQVQDFFEVTNTGTSAVPLSSITIKLWADDTSGQNVVPQINTGGCVANQGNPSCVHQVSGVTASATHFSSACGTDPSHQANWEITISDTDGTSLAPGATWSGIQTAVHLANFSSFSPGTADWYSGCLPGNAYANGGNFAIYVGGNLVRSSTGVPPSCHAPHGSQQLSGEIPPGVNSQTLVGSLPGSTPLTVGIGLPLRNASSLQTFIQQLYDPKSAQYRKYLDPAGFAAAYGPLQSDYNAVIGFAQANGLTVGTTYTSRDLLFVEGTAAAIENAFFVTLNEYKRPDGTTFYAPANEPSLNLSTAVSHVTGLSNFALARRAVGGGGTGPSGFCTPNTAGGSYAGKDFRNIYFPGCTTLDGTGQTIGLFEFDDYYSADLSDYETAFGLGAPGVTRVPLPAAPPLVTPLSLTCPGLSGAGLIGVPANCRSSGSIVDSPLTMAESDVGPGENEVALDVEMLVSMAPGAGVRVYEADTNNSAVDALTLLNAMADEPTATRPSVISSSWTWLNGDIDPSVPNVFLQFAVQGQSYFQASGDLGAYVPGGALPVVWDPIIDTPLITVVGGTELTTTAAGAYLSERTWNDQTQSTAPGGACNIATTSNAGLTFGCNSVGAGGLCNGYTVCWTATQYLYEPPGTASTATMTCASGSYPSLPIPGYQVGLPGYLSAAAGATLSTTTRMIPDVSMVADQLAVFEDALVRLTATTGEVVDPLEVCSGGTSAAAPLWASIAAMADQQQKNNGQPSIGFANPTLYTIASASPTAYSSPSGAFHDVAGGTNVYPGNALSPTSYSAVAGYDLATGLGSPNGLSCDPLNVLPPQSCMPGTSLSALVTGNDVTAYMPVGSWIESAATGIDVVPIEVTGGSALPPPSTIATGSDAINTCGGNSLTGEVVCTSNGTNVYLINTIPTTTVTTVPSGASPGAFQQYSGGICQTCNVAVDPLHNVAYMSIATSGDTGAFSTGAAFQALDLATSTLLGAPIQTGQEATSEDVLVDPLRGLVLSPNEGFDETSGGTGDYQLVNPATGGVFNFSPTGGSPGGGFDSAGEDCTTGIALATDEFTNEIFLVDLTQATFSTGTAPATWSVPSGASTFVSIPEFAGLTGSVDEAGTDGVSVVASGSHVGVVAGEFGGDAFLAIQLPSTAGAGTSPSLVDYVEAELPSTPDGMPWSLGADPHTLTAYTSPNSHVPYAIFEDDIDVLTTQDGLRTFLAVVDLNALLALPRGTSGGSPSNHQLASPLTAAQTCTAPDPVTGVNPIGCIVRWIAL